MVQDAKWTEVAFTRHIAAALADRGIETLTEFRVPGTDVTLDLFVPEMPRAAIEVTRAMSEERLAMLLRARDNFGGLLNLYVVSLRHRVLPPQVAENDPWTVETWVDPATETLEGATARVAHWVADSINGIRVHLYRLRGITGPAPKSCLDGNLLTD